MGSERVEKEVIYDIPGKTVKTCVAFFCSFLISMAGALILVWWEFKYHPTNSQLWMVPFGLVLFGTPIITWFSIFVSDICNSKKVDVSRPSQSAVSPDDSADDHNQQEVCARVRV